MSATLRRRLVSLPALYLFSALVAAALPVLVVVAWAVDAARWVATRRPWMASRLVVFLACYLAAESVGILALGVVWLVAGVGERRAARLLDGTYAVQRAWAGTIFRCVRAIFSLRFEVEGDAEAVPGPVLVLIRHTSIIDTLLPTVFLTARHGLRLRFVLKRELLVDPCLDVAGLRLPNHFVARSSEERDSDLDGIRSLGAGLSAREGVLIYPEGTRFTEARRARSLAAIERTSPERYAQAAALTHVLPPKTGGVLALLDASPESDVVIVEHKGLEGFALVVDIWRGAMVRRTVRVRCRRIARRDIPTEGSARAAWLMGEWAALDRWVRDTPE